MSCCYRHIRQKNKQHGNKQILNAIISWLYGYDDLLKLWVSLCYPNDVLERPVNFSFACLARWKNL